MYTRLTVDQDMENLLLSNYLKNALNVFKEHGATVEYVEPGLPDNMLDAAGTYLTCLWGTSLKEIAKDNEKLLCAYSTMKTTLADRGFTSLLHLLDNEAPIGLQRLITSQNTDLRRWTLLC